MQELKNKIAEILKQEFKNHEAIATLEWEFWENECTPSGDELTFRCSLPVSEDSYDKIDELITDYLGHDYFNMLMDDDYLLTIEDDIDELESTDGLIEY